jgi:hypothetical protein
VREYRSVLQGHLTMLTNSRTMPTLQVPYSLVLKQPALEIFNAAGQACHGGIFCELTRGAPESVLSFTLKNTGNGELVFFLYYDSPSPTLNSLFDTIQVALQVGPNSLPVPVYQVTGEHRLAKNRITLAPRGELKVVVRLRTHVAAPLLIDGERSPFDLSISIDTQNDVIVTAAGHMQPITYTISVFGDVRDKQQQKPAAPGGAEAAVAAASTPGSLVDESSQPPPTPPAVLLEKDLTALLAQSSMLMVMTTAGSLSLSHLPALQLALALGAWFNTQLSAEIPADARCFNAAELLATLQSSAEGQAQPTPPLSASSSFDDALNVLRPHLLPRTLSLLGGLQQALGGVSERNGAVGSTFDLKRFALALVKTCPGERHAHTVLDATQALRLALQPRAGPAAAAISESMERNPWRCWILSLSMHLLRSRPSLAMTAHGLFERLQQGALLLVDAEMQTCFEPAAVAELQPLALALQLVHANRVSQAALELVCEPPAACA